MQGTIEAVNNTGIRINNLWYNAVETIANKINPSLKGKEVIIDLMQDGRFFKQIDILGKKETVCDSDMKYRAMAVSYAKDILIADKIECYELIEIADGIFSYIVEGDKHGLDGQSSQKR
jgi:hypothetical protein